MSTIPSAYGERVVLRLLDKQAGQLNLSELRMNTDVDAGYRGALSSPHGSFWSQGRRVRVKPQRCTQGCRVSMRSRNILTIEDPVEYMLPVLAKHGEPEGGHDLRTGLHAILRQDPDVSCG